MARVKKVSTRKKTTKSSKRKFHITYIIVTLLILAAVPLTILVNRSSQVTKSEASPALLDRTVFDRKDLIYGAEIGAWDMDGGLAVNNAVARQNVKNAKIRVIRWGNWAKFDYMNQGGSTPKQTLAQFNNAIDGIRSLDAIPLIKLPPIWDQQCTNSQDYWNIEWQKEIIKNAGNRVQLYEFANEPDNYCALNSAAYSTMWNQTVPELKKYARSLGFEIYIGGPALANSYPENVSFIQNFLNTTAAQYKQTGDRDYVPDFVSSHTYLTETENATFSSMQARIDSWGAFYDSVQAAINSSYNGLNDANGSPLASQIKIADSEYNYTINNNNTRANDQSYANYYMNAMFTMFRQHNIWLAPVFTIASHEGNALDLLHTDGTPKPLYNAYAAISTTDPLNTGAQQPTVTLPPPTNTPATVTTVPTQTTAPTSVAPKPAYSVYQDVLSTGWINRSWGGKVNFNFTKEKFAGRSSIQFVARSGWAGLSVGSSNFSTSGYTYLQFYAKASKTGQKYAVYLTDSAGTELQTPQPLANYGGDPVNTTWKLYRIPLTSLNAANKIIGSITIHEWKGTSQPAVYIDNIQLTN